MPFPIPPSKPCPKHISDLAKQVGDVLGQTLPKCAVAEANKDRGVTVRSEAATTVDIFEFGKTGSSFFWNYCKSDKKRCSYKDWSQMSPIDPQRVVEARKLLLKTDDADISALIEQLRSTDDRLKLKAALFLQKGADILVLSPADINTLLRLLEMSFDKSEEKDREKWGTKKWEIEDAVFGAYAGLLLIAPTETKIIGIQKLQRYLLSPYVPYYYKDIVPLLPEAHRISAVKVFKALSTLMDAPQFHTANFYAQMLNSLPLDTIEPALSELRKEILAPRKPAKMIVCNLQRPEDSPWWSIWAYRAVIKGLPAALLSKEAAAWQRAIPAIAPDSTIMEDALTAYKLVIEKLRGPH